MSQKGRRGHMMCKKAQGLIEYSLLICIIVAALFAMRVYLKRGMQGRIRGYADELSGGFAYSPGATQANHVITRTITEDTNSYAEGSGLSEIKRSVTDTKASISQNTSRREEVLPFSAEPQR